MVQSSNFSWESVKEADCDKTACKDSPSWMPAVTQKGSCTNTLTAALFGTTQDADGLPPLPCFLQTPKNNPGMQQMWTVSTTSKKKVLTSYVLNNNLNDINSEAFQYEFGLQLIIVARLIWSILFRLLRLLSGQKWILGSVCTFMGFFWPQQFFEYNIPITGIINSSWNCKDLFHL